MIFPSNSEYVTIVNNIKKFILEPKLKNLEPIKIKNRLISYSGGYSKVFKVKIPNQIISLSYWNKDGNIIDINYEILALRFWTANIPEIQTIYKELNKFLNANNLKYFVKFEYYNNKLLWKNKYYPFVVMEWIEGDTLDKYIDKNISNSKKLKQLAEKFLEMVKILHKYEIAHGDLQNGNILVIENNNEIHLKLIDYDSIFIPTLQGIDVKITGVESFQHPQKNKLNKIDRKMDYFPELIIYLSILAYSENSNLWEGLDKQDKKLLFDAKDFKNPLSSKIFQEMLYNNYSIKIKKLTYKLIEYCRSNYLLNFDPLEIILMQDNYTKNYKLNNLENSLQTYYKTTYKKPTFYL